ncbi:hypothetical protein C8F01DRAFT_1248669 [Mycena amicta]|nr:hypothetical protein C8F01DRAFT_1248669 [Mycena amicta]
MNTNDLFANNAIIWTPWIDGASLSVPSTSTIHKISIQELYVDHLFAGIWEKTTMFSAHLEHGPRGPSQVPSTSGNTVELSKTLVSATKSSISGANLKTVNMTTIQTDLDPKNLGTQARCDASIDLTWPVDLDVSRGLFNDNNTCFLNSTVQCLLHTPPLLHAVRKHTRTSCEVPLDFLCTICPMHNVVELAYSGKPGAFAPTPISDQLPCEPAAHSDAHEFLRELVQALQESCLGETSHLTPADRATLERATWTSKIFDSQMRTHIRGHCTHQSDVYESFHNISLAIDEVEDLGKALQQFVKPATLDGKTCTFAPPAKSVLSPT